VSSSYDVIVVGAGAVGAACARELARAGRRVLMLDPGGIDGAAWSASAGMLAPQIEAGRDDPLFELGLAGRALFRELAPALRASTGIDVGYWQEGIARVALDEAEAAELRSKVAWQRQGGHRCDWLDAGEVHARWPWLRPTFGALWAPNEGAVNPAALVEALRAEAIRHGARLERDTVTALEREGDRVTGVRGASRYAAADVIVAAGAWSGRLDGLPRPLSVEPLRGQAVALEWPAKVPGAVIYSRDCYIVPREGEAVVGATREYAGFRPTTVPADIHRLADAARALSPSFAALQIRRAWAGLRPATPDGLPIIGREPRARGLWYAAGHGRNGILLAPITGVLIAQLLAGEETLEQLDAVRPERFWSC
jgi:glycine oxidase